MENSSKLRFAYLYRVLNERTDEDHPLSTSQIIDILVEEYDYEPHRTTISKDIELLKELGIDVCKIESTQNKYFIGDRKFEIPEIKLLSDAVSSSKFITEKKSKELISKLLSLTSKYQADILRKDIIFDKTVKPINKHIYYIVEAINRAIISSRKITFKYYEYDADKNKKLKNNGKSYILSPYNLIWNNDYYYVVGYSEKHKEIASFRVDRIEKAPVVLDEKSQPAPENFDIKEYSKSVFDMFKGEKVTAQLKCDNDMMKVIIDRFGEDVRTVPCGEDSFIAVVEVSRSPKFFAWVFGFEGKIKIDEPKNLKDRYREMIENIYADL